MFGLQSKLLPHDRRGILRRTGLQKPFPRGCAAPQVAHGLVVLQKQLHLPPQAFAELWQALMHVLVYRRLGKAKGFGRLADGGVMLQHVGGDAQAALGQVRGNVFRPAGVRLSFLIEKPPSKVCTTL